MLYPIQNNEQIIASNKNILLTLSGSITIEKDNIISSVPAKHYFFFDTNFDIIAASPFIEGFVIKLTNKDLETFTDLAEELTNIDAPFQLNVIQNLEDKRKKIKALLEASNKHRLAESYAHILWSELISDFKNGQKVKSIIQQFSELIEQNIEQNYCAGTYAEMMGIPLKKLIREVKKSENKTPCNFITEKVIEKAKYKLLNTDHTSQMIAYQLGFEDPYYFIKYFKKSTNFTPTQYRTKYESP